MKSIQEAVASVQNAFPSIYTKDDVIKLLESIEVSDKGSSTLTSLQINELCEKITDALKENADNLDSDAIDLSSAQFSLNYNEIELDSVDFDTREIVRNVVDGIGDVIEEFFEELNKETEEDNN